MSKQKDKSWQQKGNHPSPNSLDFSGLTASGWWEPRGQMAKPQCLLHHLAFDLGPWAKNTRSAYLRQGDFWPIENAGLIPCQRHRRRVTKCVIFPWLNMAKPSNKLGTNSDTLAKNMEIYDYAFKIGTEPSKNGVQTLAGCDVPPSKQLKTDWLTYHSQGLPIGSGWDCENHHITSTPVVRVDGWGSKDWHLRNHLFLARTLKRPQENSRTIHQKSIVVYVAAVWG